MKKITFIRTAMIAVILALGSILSLNAASIIPSLSCAVKNTPVGTSGWTITSAAINNTAPDYWKMLSGSSLVTPSMDFSLYTSINIALSLQSFGTIASNSDKIKIEIYDGTTWTQVGSLLATTGTKGTQNVSLPYTYAAAKVRITAPNASGTVGARVYSVDITGSAPSTDATLSAMSISAGTLSPAFASGTIAYTATVPYATSSITVTPTRNQANATIQAQVNGGGYATVASGSASASLSLNVGSNTVDVKVTAQDGTTIKTYTTTVTRTAAATDASLSALALSVGTLSPSFSAGQVAYTATVPYTSTSITVTPTQANSFASIQVQVNGAGYASVTSGSPSASLSLNVGTNPIDVKVTAQDGSFLTYTTTVTRSTISSDATLSNLALSVGTLSPTFDSGTITYTSSVGNGTGAITVTPTQTNAFASIQVRVNSGSYATVVTGNASSLLTLAVGDNTIDVKVTAQDATIKTYTTTVTRAAASVPTIAASGTLSAVNTTYGSASVTPTSLMISGVAMSAGIVVTPPVGYEVSTASDFSSNVGNSSSPITVGAAGVINNTTIYVRLKATVTVSGSPYSGNIVMSSLDASSVNVATSSSTVSPYVLTVSGLLGVNKIYDAGTTASLSGSASLSSTVNSDVITLGGVAVGTFASSAVADGVGVTIAGLSLTGTNSSSYSLTAPTTSANITQAPLTITGITGANKAYTGTVSASFTGTAAYVGLVGGESATPVSGTAVATFADAAVETGKTITVTGFTPYSANYSLTQPTLSADITKADQTITFGALAAKTTSDAAYAISASSTSGLTVAFESLNTAVATVAGNTITIVGVGTATIRASQAGNSNYNAAALAVDQTLTITLGAPVAGNTDIVTGSYFFANWSSVLGATGYVLDVYTKASSGSSSSSFGFEGAAVVPTNWSGTGYVQNAVATANTGTYHAGLNATNKYIRTNLITNPSSVSFYYRYSSATANQTVKVQTSPDGTTWADAATYTATGASASIVYSQVSVPLNLTGSYYIQWVMTARTGGSFYFDDVVINTPAPEVSTAITGSPFTISSGSTLLKLVSGLAYDNYYYTVKATEGLNSSLASIEKYVLVDLATPITNPSSTTAIYAANGRVNVSGATDFEVYNTQGMKVAGVKATADVTSIALRPGIYVVKTAGKVQKVVVR